MTDLGQEPDGATPLAPEERQGLLPAQVTHRHELNELEQQNIAKALLWAIARNHNPLAEPFVRGLHRRMFDDVWRWAGTYRLTNKNIGCDYWLVQERLYQLIANTQYWVDNKTYGHDEIAVRYAHGLVQIHPFPNGNGRWSRLMGDVLARRLGEAAFSWGGNALADASQTRKAYIAALKKADDNEIAPLLAFARS